MTRPPTDSAAPQNEGDEPRMNPLEPSKPVRTPLYEAFHAARYQRQAMIREIQEREGVRLISYVSGNDAPITRDAVVPFVDLLHNIPAGQGIELLLHTGGGDVDAAEKLSSMVRRKVGKEAPFRIVVPDFAKSAGTLMILGADRVVMSDTSELGPIDPQVRIPNPDGHPQWIAAQNYLDAFEELAATLSTDPENVPAQIMIGKLDPALLQFCRAVKARARKLAEKQLRGGMFRGKDANITLTASALMDTKIFPTHSQVISWEDAKEPPIELEVEYLELQSDRWQRYWQLYCLQRLAVSDGQVLYESDYASLIV